MTTHDYVVQTLPCFEAVAKANLEARGFGVYLPTVIEEIRTGRMREKRATVMAPLFPRYLFVRLDLGDSAWRQIASVRGVQRILGNDPERPSPMPDGALGELQARYAAGEFVKRERSFTVSAGDVIMVNEGVFQGHSGVCTASRGERVKVLLSLLSGAVEVDLPAKLVAVGA